MRDFNDDDKKKKSRRIQLGENPANLPAEQLTRLAEAVKASLHDGNLPCGTAFKIARETGVPRVAVGAITDQLGLRVSNCQIGCFKVDKIINHEVRHVEEDEAIASKLENLKMSDELTCVNVHKLAADLKLPPMAVADVANRRQMKIRQCQLGCF